MKRTIKGLRYDLQLTREQYAKKIGITLSSLIRYEQFKQVPPIDVAIKIAKLSKVDVNEIRFK